MFFEPLCKAYYQKGEIVFLTRLFDEKEFKAMIANIEELLTANIQP